MRLRQALRDRIVPVNRIGPTEEKIPKITGYETDKINYI